MKSSICGINCNECELNEKCKGCLETNGYPFGGACVLAERCFKSKDNQKLIVDYKAKLINEINSLQIKDMPKVKELYSLAGSFVNMEYVLPNGKKVRLLKDENIYLGVQLQKLNSDECFGIVADDEYLLICEYEENSVNPKIILYKKR